jgi:23S rRNA (pseudouridine1915-N3)-methyltransferase
MKIHLVFFGKLLPGFLPEEKKFSERLKPWVKIKVTELKESRQKNPEEKLKEEFLDFKKRIGFLSRVYILAEEGKCQSTSNFSSWIFKEFESSPELVFVIGSAYGIHSDFKAEAQGLISLSPMTLTHDYSRIVLWEQIYRSFCIANKHPYHHV